MGKAAASHQVGQDPDRVVVGMDPHKRSVTIEVMAGEETILGGGRFATTVEGYRAMRAYVSRWPQRVRAIEGCAGIGGHVASRLLGDGEQVVDVPPKLSARTRVFSTGQGRKTDATDAHSVTLVGTRMSGLRPVVDDQQLAVLRVLVDRRRSLGDDHTPPLPGRKPPDQPRPAHHGHRPAPQPHRRPGLLRPPQSRPATAAAEMTGPGGHSGAATSSSAVDSNPRIDASEKSHPGPATQQPTTPLKTAS